MIESTGGQFPLCPFCSNYHLGRCTEVKSIEYYENGTIKKVEYENGQDEPHRKD